MVLNSFFTTWGFDIDLKKVEALDKKLAETKVNADKTGDSVSRVGGKKGSLKGASFYNLDSKMGKDGRWRGADGKFLSMPGVGGTPGVGLGGKGGGKGGGFFAGFGKMIGGYEDGLKRVAESADSARRSIFLMSAAFAGGALSLGGFFKIIGDMEQTEIAFETMIGDAQLAKKTLNDLKQFSKTTPFNFAETSELSKRLLAFSFGAEELIPIMTSLGNIAAGVGKEKLPQLVLALGQVKAAGKLRGSELRQFTEAGVPLIAELGKTLGIADSKVQEMVENGQVGFDKVWQSLQRVTGEGGRFNNLMARQSTSLLGIFSNLIDSLQLMAVDLGNRGLMGKAKEFLSGIVGSLEANREQVIEAMGHAIDLVIYGMEKLIGIARNMWHVFRGLSSALGGTKKVLEGVIKGVAFLAGAKMIFLLGKFAVGIVGISRAFVGMGNAALVAQVKIGAVAFAIGAAIVGLAIVIEDIVGYFQGRKSVTGLIVGDLENIGDKIEKFVGPLIEKVKDFASNVGKWIMEGLSKLSDANWGAIASGVFKAFEIIGLLTTIPLRIGLAIASGLIEGLTAGLKERFPKIAEFLGLNEQPKLLPPPGTPGMFKDHEVGFAEGIKDLWNLLTKINASGPNRIKESLTGGMAFTSMNQQKPGQPLNFEVPITINVPAGTTPEQVGPFTQKGVQKGIESVVGEAHRATKPQVDY